MSGSSLELGQVGDQIVREPPAPGPEGLGLRGLSVPHDAEPVGGGFELLVAPCIHWVLLVLGGLLCIWLDVERSDEIIPLPVLPVGGSF